MSRPDEREHIEQFDDFRVACDLARQMSDKYDSDAQVVALDDMPDGQPGCCATGHIEFIFGIVGMKAGTLEKVAVPSTHGQIRRVLRPSDGDG
jgi:hypothetical protein